MKTHDYQKIWNLCQPFKIWQKQAEYIDLLKYLVRNDVKTVLEIGSHGGGTARGFLELGCKVTAIDLKASPTIKKLISNYRAQFSFIQGNSADPKVLELAGAMVKGQVDFLFIDGDHTEEGCLNDYLNYRHLVKPGGHIALHDIVDSELHTAQNCGVSKVWQELKRVYSVNTEFVYNGGDPRWAGMGVVQTNG